MLGVADFKNTAIIIQGPGGHLDNLIYAMIHMYVKKTRSVQHDEEVHKDV